MDGKVVGTGQLWPATKPNQPHRADVSKILVLPNVRRMGIATRIMEAIDLEAKRLKRSTLVLDTATGSEGEAFYPKLGWQKVGVVPEYAMWPDGKLCGTTVFWKKLELS
jgi:GNAT superfamily N-acetyltransferase